LEKSIEQAGIELPKSIVDIGCGAGANTARLARKFASTGIRGLDINDDLIAFAKKMNAGVLPNLNFEKGNLFDLELEGNEGVTAIQTISWVPAKDMYLPFESVLQKKPQWFAFSSLGYEGKAHARIEVEDFSESTPWATPYNILSNVVLREKAKISGYEEVAIYPYFPTEPIDSTARGMGSHTRVLDSSQLVLFSGPLYLPWYFYFFKNT
jgi:trans-aconitate methyltransferase